MNAKTVRLFVRALRGRSAKAVTSAAPGSPQWHLDRSIDLLGASGPGFNRRRLPREKPSFMKHVFSVDKGYVSVRNEPGIPGHWPGHQASIAGVFSDDFTPLDLGVSGYRKVFRGIRSALGIPKGTNIKFHRITNEFNPRAQRDRTSSVRLR